MNLVKNFRKLLFAAAMLVCMLLLASCGEPINTELVIDENFSGTRDIAIYVSNSDMDEYIEGGASAIDTVINAYKPKSVAYTKEVGADGTTYTFSTEFSGLNEYRTKVKEILDADPNNINEPEIEFSCSDSPFVQEVYFKESFTSLDLIGWLVYGLETEGIVNTTYSSDNWFEIEGNVILFNSEEYSSGSKLSIDDSVYNKPKTIDSKTYFNNDGSISREFEFVFNKTTVDNLTENGVDLQSFFEQLCPDGMVNCIEDEQGTETYTVLLSGSDSEAIASQTAALLFDNNASLHINTNAVDKAATGKDYDVQIDIMEQMSAEYYLGYGYTGFTSKYYFPDGVESVSEEIPEGEEYFTPSLKQGREEADDGQVVTYYSYVCPSKTTAVISCFSMGWSLNFEDMEIELSMSLDKPSLAVKLGISAQASTIIQDAVENNLANAVPDGVELTNELSEDSALKIFRIDFGKDDAEAIANKYQTFIYNYTGEKVLCEFNSADIETGSPFKKMKSYSAVIDFRPISGGSDIGMSYLSSVGENMTILSDSSFKTNLESSDDDAYVGTTYGYVEFYAVCEQINIVGIVAVVALAAGVVLLILVIIKNFKAIIAFFGKSGISASEAASSAVQNAEAVKTRSKAAVAAISSELREFQELREQESYENYSSESSCEDEEEEDFI